jgi:hypothetical protein
MTARTGLWVALGGVAAATIGYIWYKKRKVVDPQVVYATDVVVGSKESVVVRAKSINITGPGINIAVADGGSAACGNVVVVGNNGQFTITNHGATQICAKITDKENNNVSVKMPGLRVNVDNDDVDISVSWCIIL